MAWKKKKKEEEVVEPEDDSEVIEDSREQEIAALQNKINELESGQQQMQPQQMQPSRMHQPVQQPQQPPQPQERTVVVNQLPTQVVRNYTAEDGTIINLVTIEEALSMILNAEE